MSGLVIRSGGVVEVDTESLRQASSRLDGIAVDLDEHEVAVRIASDLLNRSGPGALGGLHDLLALRWSLEALAGDARDISRSLDAAAELYESVELLAERAAAAAAGDAGRVDLLDARIQRLAADEPAVMDAARRAFTAEPERGDLLRQALVLATTLGPGSAAMFPFLVPSMLGTIDSLGRGRVGAAQRLAGDPEPVAVRPLTTGAAAPPASLAVAAERIPHGDARVRVETYAMADGTRQFALYVSGTQSAGAGGRDPFDVKSNLQLYGGERSASYDATVAALDAAGARPGDVVHAFGHSQGAMVAERMAAEGPYDVQTLVSFGSPVQADTGDGTLSVSLRHTDDIVAALQSGGHPTGVGSPESFVVERQAHPVLGLSDLSVPAHQMSAYVETAAMVDASTDPRVDALRDTFLALGDARTVDAVDYAAERELSRPASDAG